MNLTDEQLSAFLDAELPEAEMQVIRDQLANDPALADRLATLAAVDHTLAGHYSAIDQQPLPAAVTELLEPEPAASAKVVDLPRWRRARAFVQQRVGTAVAAALVLGFGLAQLGKDVPVSGEQGWHQVAQALEVLPSGETQTLATGEQLTPRLTFANPAGEFCRQFQLQGPDRATENIACRSGEPGMNWTQVATVKVPKRDANRYQTASGGSVLDAVLDRMIEGEVMNPAREQELLSDGWRDR